VRINAAVGARPATISNETAAMAASPMDAYDRTRIVPENAIGAITPPI